MALHRPVLNRPALLVAVYHQPGSGRRRVRQLQGSEVRLRGEYLVLAATVTLGCTDGMAVEAGLMIRAPIHDALLSEADLPDKGLLDRVYEWRHALI